jgi:polysaccharide biosynthesis/export protein
MVRMPQPGIWEPLMRYSLLLPFAVSFAALLSAQQQPNSSHVGAGASSLSDGSNLPVEKIGNNDLIGITVYDEPELTRTVRIGSDGEIRLPMLRRHIQAAGIYPAELETAITSALVEENVLVEPIVTVSVIEYRSRPITIAGAVKTPATFQAIGTVTLLDAISRAGGLTDNAGSEILVSHPAANGNDKPPILTKRVSVSSLYRAEDPASNLTLQGGDNIRVPEAGRIFVAGNVKKPGAFYITDGSESSVMKALALSEGLDSFASHKAYIYRVEGGSGGRNEIPIELKKILNRKSPDVPLLANDILYIPTATGAQASLKVLQASVGLAAGFGTALLYVSR